MPSIKQSIKMVLAILAEKKAEAEFALVFARLFQKHGLTKKTFRDYLDALRTAGKIDYPAGQVTTMED